jgi:hypothetical protein
VVGVCDDMYVWVGVGVCVWMCELK